MRISSKAITGCLANIQERGWLGQGPEGKSTLLVLAYGNQRVVDALQADERFHAALYDARRLALAEGLFVDNCDLFGPPTEDQEETPETPEHLGGHIGVTHIDEKEGSRGLV